MKGHSPVKAIYGYVPPQREGCAIWSESRYRLCSFWSGIGYDFQGFEMDFKKYFLLLAGCSNLSNDGLGMGVDFRGQV